MGGSFDAMEGKFGDVALGEINGMTHCDLQLLKKILTAVSEGKYLNIIRDPEGLLRKLYTAPGQAVLIVANEMNSASLARAAGLYIQERANNSPESIYKRLQHGDLPELDTAHQGYFQEIFREHPP